MVILAHLGIITLSTTSPSHIENGQDEVKAITVPWSFLVNDILHVLYICPNIVVIPNNVN